MYAIFSFFFFIPLIFYAEVRIRFDHLTIYDGLSQASVTTIIQDSKGYMWIGTQDGLNRFNGYDFTIFKNDPNDKTTISDNSILKIYEDRTGNIWIATLNGLNQYNRQTETFIRYFFREKSNKKIKSQFISIIEDSYSNLWIGSRRNGLIKFNKKNKNWVRLVNNKNDPDSLSSNNILTLSNGKNGDIWIGTSGGGLNRYDIKKNKFTSYKNKLNDINSISNNTIRAIFFENKNKIWLGTHGGGLNVFDSETEIFNKFIPDKPLTYNQYYNWITKILKDSTGSIWIGTSFGGIIKIVSFEEGKFINFRHDYLYKYSLCDDTINDINEDRTGNIWIGTHLKGISVLKKQKQQFSHFFISGNSKIINKAKSFFEDDNILWYGTLGPLVKIDNKINSNKTQYYYPDAKKSGSISGVAVNSIYRDKKNNLWFATTNGLNQYNPDTDKFKVYLPDSNNASSISGKYISYITEDADDNLWIGTYNGGLNRYDHSKDGFQSFKKDKHNKDSIGSNDITSIINDPENKNILWIGSYSNGLDRFDRKTEKFEHFIHDPEDRNSISSNFVLSVHVSKKYPSIIWVGTWGGGFNKYNRGKNKWTLYTEKNELCNNTVYGILEDNDNKLWLSTINGLAKYDPETEEFKDYYAEDGLQSNEFNMCAYHKGKSGTLYFGGINGFTFFNPEKVKKNNLIPPIVLTSFKKFNKEVKLGKTISELKEIVLRHEDNVFSFEFASLDYNNSKKNKYSYKLEGFNKEWINANYSERVANFTNIPHGTYYFRVKGTNNDGLWNEKGVSIRIIILPPFWKTLWFKMFVFFLIVSCIYFIHRKRMKKLTVKLERENKINALCVNYGITKREKEVLDLILSGKSNNQIIEILSISSGTVKSHTHNIYNKAGVNKRNELYIKFSEL